MLDAKFVRENLDLVDKAIASRNVTWDSERFVELDEKRRDLITQVEQLQAKRNKESDAIGALMREGKKEEAEAAKADVSDLKDKIASLDEERSKVEEDLHNLMAAIPNIPDESLPLGSDDSENVEVRRWGQVPDFSFEPKAHWDLGPELNIIEFARGV